MKRQKVKGIIAATVAGALLLGAADSASALPMKPAQVKQFVFKRAATYNNINDMHPVRVLLTRNRLTLSGSCRYFKTPSGVRYQPFFRFWQENPRGVLSESCSGQRVPIKNPTPKYGGYERRLDSIGSKLGRNAGASSGELDRASKVLANNERATVWFKKPDQPTGSYVTKIVFRLRGKPIVKRVSMAANSLRAVSDEAIQACLKKRADEGPARVSGRVRRDGRVAYGGAIFYNQWSTIDCRQEGSTRIQAWVKIERRPGRFFRSSRVHRTQLNDEGGVSVGRAFNLRPRYTCLPGPRMRGIRLVMKVTARYEGQSRTRTFRSGKIINPPSAAGYLLAGKVKC